MVIVFPMAGLGQRFVDAGFKEPKPMIDVCGKPMIQRAIESLNINGDYVYIALGKHLDNGLREILKGEIVEIYEPTQGAACTVLLAEKYLKGELIISNCDQYLDFDSANFLNEARKSDGCLVTFNSTNPHHSYAKVVHGKVVEVAEKKVISDHASAGVYYFKDALDFIWAANTMIRKDIRTNNEFYICPVFNELIGAGKTITNYEIDVNSKHMLGTPYELQIFKDKVENGEIKL